MARSTATSANGGARNSAEHSRVAAGSEQESGEVQRSLLPHVCRSYLYKENFSLPRSLVRYQVIRWL